MLMLWVGRSMGHGGTKEIASATAGPQAQGPGKVLFPQIGGGLSECSRRWAETRLACLSPFNKMHRRAGLRWHSGGYLVWCSFPFGARFVQGAQLVMQHVRQ
jgi:hypothetical protein